MPNFSEISLTVSVPSLYSVSAAHAVASDFLGMPLETVKVLKISRSIFFLN